jgi:hypothetical protein
MKVTNTPTNVVGLGSTIQIDLPNWDMNHKFMCREFDFSTQGHATLFACTTTLISLDQTLEFFNYSTPSSIPLVAIPLFISVVNSA